ncbi:MAG: formylglycine-generating enzyme family protein [Prevotellaceae bacterium]|jgi:formylglycine-generating enzyme required for sulfatase activity|nr:formylglycine-generating enzyme family protein [Prevotellaceae bacterium]
MKKQLLFLSLVLSGMLASCSEESSVSVMLNDDTRVSFNVRPQAESLATRADVTPPTVPDGYALRYVLEIRETGSTEVLQRIEQVNDASMDFNLQQGTYDFLFWVDYLKTPYLSDAETGCYADQFYDTQDLNAVARIAIPTDDLSVLDAFSGKATYTKTNDALNESIVLTRPFARINLIVAEAKKARLEKIKSLRLLSPKIGSLNVQTGSIVPAPAPNPDAHVAEIPMDTVQLSKPDGFSGEETNFIFDYWFAPADAAGTVTQSTMSVTFYSDADYETINNTFDIPAAIPYIRNYQTNLTAGYIDDLGGSVTVTVESAWEDDVIDRDLDMLPRFVSIPAKGVVWLMGDESCAYSVPIHYVKLTKDFDMSEAEITNAMYCYFLNTAGIIGEEDGAEPNIRIVGKKEHNILIYESLNESDYGVHWNASALNTAGGLGVWEPAPEKDDCPVVNVTWYGAQLYVDWLSDLLGQAISLPTEAQWEFACRANTSTLYYYGEEPDEEYMWYNDNSDRITQPVKTRLPNAFGLYDMLGNAVEWCDDWYGTYPTAETSEDAIVDPVGADAEEAGYRAVVRGGSAGTFDSETTSFWRWNYPADFSNEYVGFRVVRNP